MNVDPTDQLNNNKTSKDAKFTSTPKKNNRKINNNNNNDIKHNGDEELNKLYPNLNRLHKHNRNSIFFNDIDNERNKTLSKQKCTYHEDPTASPTATTTTTANTMNIDNNNNINDNSISNKIKHLCNLCSLEFDNVVDYENHYYSNHQNFCTICKKISYPTYKLLECHILETHDKLFETLCTKKKMFECFECEKLFWTDHSRKLHLVEHHKYPKEFHFHTHLRSKELEKLRLKGLEIKKKNENSGNSKNEKQATSPDSNLDKMELDQVIMDMESINTKKD